MIELRTRRGSVEPFSYSPRVCSWGKYCYVAFLTHVLQMPRYSGCKSINALPHPFNKSLVLVFSYLFHEISLPESLKPSTLEFILRRKYCPVEFLKNTHIPHSESASYLELNINRRLTWNSHIKGITRKLSIKTKKCIGCWGENRSLVWRTKFGFTTLF